MDDETTSMRRFKFVRSEDVSGVSGTGVVCEGVEYTDGSVSVRWLTHTSSVGYYANIKQFLAIHGHGGCGEVIFIDPNPDDQTTPKKKRASKK